jgi:hypothetical protein
MARVKTAAAETSSSVTLTQALTVFSAGQQIYTEYQATDRSTGAALDAVSRLLSMLVEKGITLGQLIEIVDVVKPFASLLARA